MHFKHIEIFSNEENLVYLVSTEKNEERGRVSDREPGELESGKGGGREERSRECRRRRHSGSTKIKTKIMAIGKGAEICMVPAAVVLQLLPLLVSQGL
jgi:hypothetical protein